MTPDHRTGPRGRPSRRALQRDLRALAALDGRDQAFAQRLERLLEHTSVSASPPWHTSTTTTPPAWDARPKEDQGSRAVRVRSRRWTQHVRWSLAALVVAILAASGRLAYLDLANRSAGAAAQAILHRAAVAESHLPRGHAIHLVYRFSTVLAGSGRLSGTLDIWIQADAQGGPPLVAQTQTTVAGGSAVPRVTRRIMHGTSGQEYLSSDNTVRRVLDAAGAAELFISGPRYVSVFAQGAGQAQLLPSRRLDGAPVDAVQVDAPYAPGYTVYVDARSYILRGVDIAAGRRGRVRLVRAVTLPATAVPPGTFTLHAPPTARMSSQIDYVSALPSVDHPALALVSICQIVPSRLRAAVAAGMTSPLALCQAREPAMRKAALIAALLAEERARLGLDEGVAVGKLTPAQEAGQVAALQMKLATWVMHPLID